MKRGLHQGQYYKQRKEQKNEYNTYKIDGLPPGPIANVGRAALEAVANPYPTKDLYFVADGSGGHAFAETYDEHKINVAKWRKIEKERKDAEKTEKLGSLSKYVVDVNVIILNLNYILGLDRDSKLIEL